MLLGKRLQTTTYTLPAGPSQKEDICIVFLTDLHDACGPQEADRLITSVKACRPDLILCGGDMIVSRDDHVPEKTAMVLARLAGEAPFFYASGNHEARVRRIWESASGKERQRKRAYLRFRRILEKAGVLFLENADERLTLRGMPVRVCGLDPDMRYYRRVHGPQMPPEKIREIFGSPDPQEYTILLAHTPRLMPAYAGWGADLTLCGHYHGGVMRLGPHRGLVSPDLRLFPGNAYGLFQHGQKTTIVSAGCGEHTIPIRIGNPREIVCCRLAAGKAETEDSYGNTREAAGI